MVLEVPVYVIVLVLLVMLVHAMVLYEMSGQLSRALDNNDEAIKQVHEATNQIRDLRKRLRGRG